MTLYADVSPNKSVICISTPFIFRTAYIIFFMIIIITDRKTADIVPDTSFLSSCFFFVTAAAVKNKKVTRTKFVIWWWDVEMKTKFVSEWLEMKCSFDSSSLHPFIHLLLILLFYALWEFAFRKKWVYEASRLWLVRQTFTFFPFMTLFNFSFIIILLVSKLFSLPKCILCRHV